MGSSKTEHAVLNCKTQQAEQTMGSNQGPSVVSASVPASKLLT